MLFLEIHSKTRNSLSQNTAFHSGKTDSNSAIESLYSLQRIKVKVCILNLIIILISQPFH
ncbi:MAG: hypothetical protein LBC61_03715 [Candidatus Peribacteria bacterium]|nr:hypothetical protein [Candidatus Peribacteria bacterium]